MTDSTRLDASKLLGFGRDGEPLHELVIPASADGIADDGAQGSVRAQGTPKPGGFIKAQGDLKPTGGIKPLGSIKTPGLGGKNLIVAAGIGGKTGITAVGITKADGRVKTGKA